MGKPKELVLPPEDDYGPRGSGIAISYIKSHDVLYISGFYDGGCGGIQGTEISVKEFCEKLGIDLKRKR